MELSDIVNSLADIAKEFDSEKPRDKEIYKPGIGPFQEVQLVKEVAARLTTYGFPGKSVTAKTHITPDMSLRLHWGTGNEANEESWALEFKIVRPYGDNGKIATNWSRRLLYPYEGNESLMGDALKLLRLKDFQRKGLIAICFEHSPPQLDLEPILASFELITRDYLKVNLGKRMEAKRGSLVHPVHQTLRCIGWELA